MADFYGKLIGTKVYTRLVRIVDGDIYYMDANFKEIRIGLCEATNDELHLTRRTNNCIVLDGIDGKFSIEQIRAGRSKKDEIWHRWASLSEHERGPYLKKALASAYSTAQKQPRVIAKFHTPIGHAQITGIIITRNGHSYHYGDTSEF